MIRKGKSSDLEECKKIIFMCFKNNIKLKKKSKEFFLNTYLSKNYLKNKVKNSIFCVVEEKEKIIAMGMLEKCCIKKVFIHPRYQGKGIGTKIMKKLENIALKKGCKKVYGYCFPNSISFCKKNDFDIVKKVYFLKKGVKLSATLVEKHL
ncbi:MAG: GNAT family N-acetyltransferase [archaeon]